MKKMIKALGTLMVVYTTGQHLAVAAEAYNKPVSECSKLTDSKKRLECYDQANKTDETMPASKAEHTQASWSGAGLTTTRLFHVDGPWELQWDAKGGYFGVYLYRKGQVSGQSIPNILANQTSTGTGSTYVPSGGDYYLIVNAMGSWSAKLVNLPE